MEKKSVLRFPWQVDGWVWGSTRVTVYTLTWNLS